MSTQCPPRIITEQAQVRVRLGAVTNTAPKKYASDTKISVKII